MCDCYPKLQQNKKTNQILRYARCSSVLKTKYDEIIAANAPSSFRKTLPSSTESPLAVFVSFVCDTSHQQVEAQSMLRFRFGMMDGACAGALGRVLLSHASLSFVAVFRCFVVLCVKV